MRRNIEKDLMHWKQKKKRKPLLLKGARQVGKTFSLKKFGKESFKSCHYINLEKDDQVKKSV